MTRQKLSGRGLIKGSAALGLSMFPSPIKAAAPEPVAITPQLIDAAKREGKVVLYSAMDLPVGEKLGNTFQAQYPGIDVQIERSGSERLFERIAQEFSSNINAADMITTADASTSSRGNETAGSPPSSRKTSRNIFQASIATPTACLRRRASGCRRSPITPISSKPPRRPRASKTCSTPNGPARWSRGTPLIAAPS